VGGVPAPGIEGGTMTMTAAAAAGRPHPSVRRRCAAAAGLVPAALLLALWAPVGTGSPLGAAAAVVPADAFGSPVWSVGPIPDAGLPIALSSPNVADLPGGPAVVVGDQAGNVYAYNLATGGPEWTYATGAPVTSTPSVAPTTAGSPFDTVFVGTGDAGSPTAGGYQAISPGGGDQWYTQEDNPPTDATAAHSGVQASMAVGDLQGGTDVVAGSLGEEEDALTAGGGGVLAGFPWYQADSNFSTPALADLYGTGANEIVEGGASSPGLSYTTTYQPGGHLRVLSARGNLGQPHPNGGLVCQHTTNEAVQASPAVGEFFGSSSEVGIVFGTGNTYHQSDTDHLMALDSHCNVVWSVGLDGDTSSSPALADVEGNGQLQVVEGTDDGTGGSVYALDGATGAVLWQTRVGRVIGSVATVDLGNGYQDVLAPTVNGVAVLDGRTGAVVTTLDADTGFQNTPLVTDDPNGTIGITFAGYQASGSFIYHYELAGSDGSRADEVGAWPQFHHDPSLSGDAGTPQNIEVPCTAPGKAPDGYYLSAADGGIFNYGNLPFCGSTGSLTLDQPVVGMATTVDGGGYWEVAADGGLFAFGNATYHGSMGGKPLVAPIVAMAATPTGGGYWEVAADGGIFAFGNAGYHGSMGGKPLVAPIVGMAATPTGGGYWLVAADGGIFGFGNATYHGSMGGRPLVAPIVGMAGDTATGGYWMVASDGGIFSFTAPFLGSMGGMGLNAPIVGMASLPSGRGYRFVAADGGIFSFTAPFLGSMGGQHLNKPIVSMAGI
jgi:hypothetical protein